MKYGLFTACFVAILLSPLTAKSVGDEDLAVTIAVVNVTYLMENSPEAELASKALKAKFSPKELALAKEQDAITLLETARETRLHTLQKCAAPATDVVLIRNQYNCKHLA